MTTADSRTRNELIAANILFTRRELADMTHRSVDYYARLACEGRGPRAIKFAKQRSGTVRYRLSDVQEWLASLPQVGTPAQDEDLGADTSV